MLFDKLRARTVSFAALCGWWFMVKGQPGTFARAHLILAIGAEWAP